MSKQHLSVYLETRQVFHDVDKNEQPFNDVTDNDVTVETLILR